jgi:hypothetical protein
MKIGIVRRDLEGRQTPQ